MQSIEITSLVGHPPFSITICDITYTYCYFAISGVTSAPITITPPTQLNGVNQLLVVITDSKGCETINYINCFTPTPTPTLTPTPTITPTNLSCSCIAFINVGTGNLNFGYILCDETIFTGVIPQSTTFYVCGKLPFADENVIISINGVCVDNSCPTSEITPTPTNTQTPTITPTNTLTPTVTPTDVSACIPQTIYNNEKYTVLMQNSYSSFYPDGTKVYFTRHNTGVGSSTGYDPIIMYNLGTPWDVSTIIANGFQSAASGVYAIPAAVSINTDTIVSSAQGHCFSPDGTKIFVCNASSGVLRKFTVSTPWDITTMSLSASATTYGTSLSVVKFTPDGLTMVLLGTGGLKKYTLTSAWDIIGGTLTSTSATGFVSDFNFQNNGLYLFTFNSGNNLIRYTLSSPYNITGITSTQTLNLSGSINMGSGPRILFKDGYKGYISSYYANTPHTISAFNLTCPFDISGSLPIPSQTPTQTPTLTPTITPTQTMTPSPTPQYRFEPNDSAYLIDFIDNSTSGYFYGAYTGYSENNVVPAGGIIKLNQDLTIDYSFTGGTGFAGPYDYFYNGESIIQQPDGKIIATGFLTSYSGVSKNRIVRLNVDGSIDNTFVMGSGFNGFYTAVPGIDSLGNIIVPGYFSTYNGVTTPIYGLAKLSSGGTMDMTFSATTGFAGAPTIPQGVLVNPDDSMYVTGYFTSFSGISANHIIKLQSNGYKDDSFNYGTGFNSYGEEAINTFRISGETSFYVVGTNYNGGGFTMYNGTPVNRILKLMSDGTIDPSFNSGTGLSGGTADLSSYCTIIWTNKLLLWGTFTSYNGTPSLNWIILNSDGTVFQSFTTEYNLIFAIGNKLYGQQSTGYLELIMIYP
jgi:hypothetical protein